MIPLLRMGWQSPYGLDAPDEKLYFWWSVPSGIRDVRQRMLIRISRVPKRILVALCLVNHCKII
jgi:hypothetical protein